MYTNRGLGRKYRLPILRNSEISSLYGGTTSEWCDGEGGSVGTSPFSTSCWVSPSLRPVCFSPGREPWWWLVQLPSLVPRPPKWCVEGRTTMRMTNRTNYVFYWRLVKFPYEPGVTIHFFILCSITCGHKGLERIRVLIGSSQFFTKTMFRTNLLRLNRVTLTTYCVKLLLRLKWKRTRIKVGTLCDLLASFDVG